MKTMLLITALMLTSSASIALPPGEVVGFGTTLEEARQDAAAKCPYGSDTFVEEGQIVNDISITIGHYVIAKCN